MSHADPGPLASYNSLQDKHLAGYFSNSRMKRHLKRSGLVTKNGKIIDEKTYRLNMAKKEHRKHVRDLLATAIVHKTLDMERVRQYEIRKTLDEIYKVELVRRVKEGRNRKGDEDILPLLSPRERTAHMQRKTWRNKHKERPSTAPAILEDSSTENEGPIKPSEIYYDDDTQMIYYRVNSTFSHPQTNGYLKDETEELGPSPYTGAYPATYPAPAPPPTGTPRHTRTAGSPRRGIKLKRFHYLARTEPAVARRVQLQSMAEVTMKFLGPSLILTNSMFPEDRLSEVMVLQQHCGGSTLCVFRELLPPNTIFTFISRRHRGAPFGLTFYIDGLQDIRLSSCCEYKHRPGHILGGKNGHFQFVMVEGAAPCYRCQVASSHKGRKSKHRASQGDEDDRTKTFMTEAGNEEEQEEEDGQVFDVIITKIKPPGEDDADDEQRDGDMVDSSTQTPRYEDSSKPEEEVTIQEAVTTGTAPEQHDKEDEEAEVAEESGADKYDDDEFEESPEKDKEKESESEAKEETDNENNVVNGNEDYKDDFESEEEKEKEKHDDEEPDKESDNESDKESDQKSDKSDKESDKVSDKESDKEEIPEEDIQDETENKEAQRQEEADEVDEVEDETDGKNDNNSSRPGSAASSEGKQSKNVSFDEDVTVFEDEQDEVPEEEETQNHEEPKADKEEPEEVDEEAEEGETKEEEEPDESSSSEDSDGEVDRTSKKNKTKHTKTASQDPGSDPDLVSTGQLPERALKAVGVKPGTKHEGSVQTLLEGKEDIELVGVELTRDQFEEVARIVDAREHLTSFILRNTGADDTALEVLVDSLKNSRHLKMLNLSVNRIGPKGAKHLAEVIKGNNSLKMLLLHGNPLADEGVEILIDAILETPNTSIINLDFGDCGVTQDGAQHIARLIEKNSSINILTISGNTIHLEGWQKIGQALTSNSKLETLSLDFNKIGDEEAFVIAQGLQGCKSLRSVDLEGNKIGDNGGRRLFEAVKVNKSIVDLTLMPMNQISKEILHEIKEFLVQRAKGNEPPETEQDNQDISEEVQPNQESGEQSQENRPHGDGGAEKVDEDAKKEQEGTEDEQQDKDSPESDGGQDEQGDKEENKEEVEQPAPFPAEEDRSDSPGEEQPEEQPKPDSLEAVSQPADDVPDEGGERAIDVDPSQKHESASVGSDENERKSEKEKDEGEEEPGVHENNQERSGEAVEESSGQGPSNEESSAGSDENERKSEKEKDEGEEEPGVHENDQERSGEAVEKSSGQGPSNEESSAGSDENERKSEKEKDEGEKEQEVHENDQERSGEAAEESSRQGPANEESSEQKPSQEVISEQGPSEEQSSEQGSLGQDNPNEATSEGEKNDPASSDVVASVDENMKKDSQIAVEEISKRQEDLA